MTQPSDFKAVTTYLQNRVTMGRLPGAVLAVGTTEQLYFYYAVGYSQVFPEPERRPMQLDTIFDLASLTKVVATLPSVMILVEQGNIRLDQSVSHYLPEFQGKDKEKVTVRHLLTHTAGLPASKDFYSHGWNLQQMHHSLFETDLVYKTGSEVVYSDLGFMLLGILVERVSGLRLDQFAYKHVFAPLQMNDTRFNPPLTLKNRTAATEYRNHLDRYQCAEVHDENAGAMGGISGHAGLFATLADLVRYATCFMQDGTLGRFQLLRPETVTEMRRLQTIGLHGSRGLGWVMYRPGDGSFGGCFDSEGYGHTGFTGTSLYLNPQQNLFVVLLTNRVHFGRTDDMIQIRQTVHRLIYDAVRG
jgi:CubicO group peptidase (beta-lactamase class C family)